MKVERSKFMLHPVLSSCVDRIQSEVIKKHLIPFRLFETGRLHERHQELLSKGKTLDIISSHLYNLDIEPPIYSTAVDYVFYNGKWSWNLRDDTIISWYKLFGNMVLDVCPELEWGGNNRKSIKYDHFQLSKDSIYSNLKEFPCTILE